MKKNKHHLSSCGLVLWILKLLEYTYILHQNTHSLWSRGIRSNIPKPKLNAKLAVSHWLGNVSNDQNTSDSLEVTQIFISQKFRSVSFWVGTGREIKLAYQTAATRFCVMISKPSKRTGAPADLVESKPCGSAGACQQLKWDNKGWWEDWSLPASSADHLPFSVASHKPGKSTLPPIMVRSKETRSTCYWK